MDPARFPHLSLNPFVSRIPILAQFLRLARWLYDWMLAFADKPYAGRALFGLSFVESSFFPLPPDPLLMAMGAEKPDRAIRFAGITTLGSVLGAMLGFAIGAFLMGTLGEWLLDLYDRDRHTWGKVEDWFGEYGLFGLLIAAITPIPFKVFTIASGAMTAIDFLPFVGACIVGRGFRFYLEGILLKLFGRPILEWMEKWFDLAAILFTVLLVGGFVIIKYL
jgi:membrane protein YqaA with SNARE-associated domain